MFGRRREPPGPDGHGREPERPAPVSHDALLAAVVAQHLDGAQVVEGTARVVGPELTVLCHVPVVTDLGRQRQAACFFQLSGGRLGSTPVFTSVPGYGPSEEEAVAQGGHSLAGLVSALLGAIAGREPSAAHPVVRCQVVLDGRRFGLVVAGLDRGPAGPDAVVRLGEFREALGGTPFLLPPLIGDVGCLPLLQGDDAALVSLFVAQWPSSRTVELKVHGADWTTTGLLDDPVGLASGDDAALLRELAMLVPLDPPAPVTREAVQRTLDGLAERRTPRQAAGWQGWTVHGGRLGPVLDHEQLAAVEAGTGPLPNDVRDFLLRVAGPGAGPGYGLLPLRRAGDVVPLAHAGCGNAWVLALEGQRRGTVWLDASGSAGETTQVASSFTEWFTDWLDAAVRDTGPWLQYDVRGCSPVSAMSRALTARSDHAAAAGEPEPTSLVGMPDGAICTVGEATYLPHGPMDPCHGCVSLAGSLGLAPTVFAPGLLMGAR
ncbi:SMI1/KNR4 family protein [Cellulomonas sp. zg-ZUI199]|uniref:SMI1/KNR4 family protein n=1 Tax=Cellulomonas wangleii TaxID=2816956 RepID=A0ABX8D8M5_9CELL|nr:MULTISPECIES: SMI1/KNR4 family protein [Cellulomonas]MBO0900873.1 SMI1/KNR4 family protein [Cellulomonas sp. zg-ZUI22]MBO0925024.1 SMI1/KNR4 family protein [Cellulomonas wangleii]QVI63556.1 SMI1/KNR4 family protein [Cellulomonas wangleii]